MHFRYERRMLRITPIGFAEIKHECASYRYFSLSWTYAENSIPRISCEIIHKLNRDLKIT